VLPDTDTGGYYVQDRKASLYEYNFAWALDKRGLDYAFQFDILGGRLLKGGMVIDFLVFTVPLSTPVWIHGEYWHMGKQAMIDKYQKAILDYVMAGEVRPAKIYWGVDVATKDLALAKVRRDFG